MVDDTQGIRLHAIDRSRRRAVIVSHSRRYVAGRRHSISKFGLNTARSGEETRTFRRVVSESAQGTHEKRPTRTTRRRRRARPVIFFRGIVVTRRPGTADTPEIFKTFLHFFMHRSFVHFQQIFSLTLDRQERTNIVGVRFAFETFRYGLQVTLEERAYSSLASITSCVK